MMGTKQCECGCSGLVTTPDKWGNNLRFLFGHAQRGKNNGMYGYSPTPEERKRHSMRMSGENNPFYGKKHTVKTRKIISKKVSKSMTPEHRKEISERMTGKVQPKGKDSHGWKGGKSKTPKGYVLKHRPSHPLSYNGYVKEHRLIMEKHIGRYLRPEEVVHHINLVKTDNRLSNLWLFKNQSEHGKHHRKLEKAKIAFLEKAFDLACKGGNFFDLFTVKEDASFNGMPPLWTPEEVGICIDEMTGEVLYMPEEYR